MVDKIMDDFEIKRKKDESIRKEHEEAGKKRPAESVTNSIGMEFVLIPAGEFQIGTEKYSDARTVHKVIVSKPFYLGKYPVTQDEWRSLMGNDPSCFEGDNRPVECISWHDVQEFVKRLNAKEGTDKYRLPSGAEWEYACRAGTTTKYSFGDDESKLGEYAWYYDNSEHQTHPVGQKKPNPWGLYDMHGNVWEWCQDRYHRTYVTTLNDGSVLEATNNSGLVLHGGGWVNYAAKCQSAYRSSFHPDYGYYSLGFRLLRSV